MTIGAISDVHGNLDGLDFSDCDIAVFAGDITSTYGFHHHDILKQVKWMEKEFSDFTSKFQNTQFVIIPGNHDLFADPAKSRMVGNGGIVRLKLPQNVHYLVNERKTVLGVTFQGISWVPHINGMWAYEDGVSGRNLEAFCESITEHCDVLITHSPPRLPGEEDNIDVSLQVHPSWQEHFGSNDIYDLITRITPRYVFCGHIHTGDHKVFTLGSGDTEMYNVSRVDENYKNAFEILKLHDVTLKTA